MPAVPCYAFAGIETDLTADSLQQVGDNNGEPVFADPDGAQPFPELFFSSSDGLLRFVLVGDDGRPASIAESLAFDGTEFAFESDATDTVDRASLTKVGCSTAYPVFAPTETVDAGFTQLYVLAGTRLFSFTNAGAAPAQETDPPTTSTTSTTTTTTPSTTGPPTAQRSCRRRSRRRRSRPRQPPHPRRRRNRRRPPRRRRQQRQRNRRRPPRRRRQQRQRNRRRRPRRRRQQRQRPRNRRQPPRRPRPRRLTRRHHVDHLDVDDIDVDQLDDHDTGDYVDHHDDGTVGCHDNTVPRQPRRAQRAGDPGAPADADPVRWRRLCLCRV